MSSGPLATLPALSLPALALPDLSLPATALPAFSFASFVPMLSAVGAVYAVILTGAVARRTGLLTRSADESLLRGMVTVLFPAFILGTLLGRRDTMNLSGLGLPPVLGFVITVGGFAIGYGVARLVGPRFGLDTPTKQRTFGVTVGIGNYGFVPIPLAEALFRDPAGSGPDPGVLATLIVHNFGVDLAMWTVGILLLVGRFKADWWRPIVNWPLGAMVTAIVLNTTGGWAYVPTMVLGALDLLGRCAIPVALIVTGATMADAAGGLKPSAVAGDTSAARTITLACLLRLGVLPVLMLAVGLIIPAAWGMGVPMRRVLALEAAMPSALFPVVLARLYGGDIPTAVRVIVGTSIVALVTIPLWLTLGLATLNVVP